MIPYAELTSALARYRARMHGVAAESEMPTLSSDDDELTAMGHSDGEGVNVDDILSEETRS